MTRRYPPNPAKTSPPPLELLNFQDKNSHDHVDLPIV